MVDDQEAYVEAYATWLRGEYEVRTATNGFEALDLLDHSVDVVLLDRRMPRLSGDDVLREIRERGYDCRVAMITAVEPDLDIVEMEFDEYLVKPVGKDELYVTIEELLRRVSLDANLKQCYSLVARKVTLENSRDPRELEASDEYLTLLERIEATESETDEVLTDLIEAGSVDVVYHDIET
ncbi:MAG: response regulator [Halobacteriales archaeon]|nr:response regulator [Halobacteriales archaeon]